MTRRWFMAGSTGVFGLFAPTTSTLATMARGYKIEERLRGKYRSQCLATFSGIPAGRKARIFIAKPASLPGQTPLETSLEIPRSDFVAKTTIESGPAKREFLVIDVITPPEGFDVLATYDSILCIRGLTKGDPSPSVNVAPKLSVPPRINLTDDTFTSWVEKEGLVKEATESELDFLARVHFTILRIMKYGWKEGMNRDLATILTTKIGDCAAGNMLWAATALLNRIPAEALCGTRVGVDGNFPYHVLSRAHVSGLGWVTNDATPLQNGEGTRPFGTQDSLFLTHHRGPGIFAPTPEGVPSGTTPSIALQGILLNMVDNNGNLTLKRPTSEQWNHRKM